MNVSLIHASIWIPLQAFAAESTPYIVKERDTLTDILYESGSLAIYGKKGALEKTLTLNPNQTLNHGNRIFPGQVIYLPFITPEMKVAHEREVASEKMPAPVVLIPASDLTTSVVTETEVKHLVQLGLVDRFENIQATDLATGARANLYTTTDLGLEISLKQTWSDTAQSYFNITLEKLSFAPSSNQNKVLNNDSVTKTGFTMGMVHALSSKFNLGYSASYSSELFVRGLNSSSISIDQKPVAGAGLNVAVTVVQKGQTKLSLGAEGNYLFQSSTDAYDIQSGYSAGVNAQLHYRPESGNEYTFSLGYLNRSQNSSVVNQTENQISAQLSFGLSLFKESADR